MGEELLYKNHTRRWMHNFDANESGLRSLAKHLLCLADTEVPVHYHIHLDESNSLEDGSFRINNREKLILRLH